jgi:hypothetical protein
MQSSITRKSFIAGAAAAGIAGTAAASLAGHVAVAEEPHACDSEEALGKWSFEIAPDGIADDQIVETIEADIVVVGAGTGGLTVANSAAEEGADVILVSASTMPISRGGSNHAVYSKTMEALGIPRNDGAAYERELMANGCRVDARKWYKFFNNSEVAMNWLIDIMEAKGYTTGIEGQVPTLDIEDGSIFYLPGAHGFYNDENPGMGMNQPLIVNELATRFEELTGKPIYYENIARQLVRGGVANGIDGAVDGVICERADGTYAKYVAHKAVVLATGDFSTNYEMMAKYAPQAIKYITPELFDEEPNYDRTFAYGGLFPGDGQKMGLWIGAAWQKAYPCAPNGGGIAAGPMDGILPFTGIKLSRDGKRFCNEYGFLGTGSFTNEMSCPGGIVYSIWDVNYAEQYPFDWIDGSAPWGQPNNQTPEDVVAGWESSVESGAYVKADTLEELIEKLGLPDEALASIERYNADCAAGEDTEYHKNAAFMIPVEKGPFYGQVGTSSLFLTILGGLRTDENMAVCDEDDNPIPGLYNVGSMVGDMYYAEYTYMIPGFTYGSSLTLSYLLGKDLAQA